MCDLDASIQVVRAQLEICLSVMRREEAMNNSLSSCVQKTRSYSLDHIVTFLKLFGTIPITTASAEQSFSSLKRLKTELPSTMSEEGLNGLALLASHQLEVETDEVFKLRTTFFSLIYYVIHFGLQYISN